MPVSFFMNQSLDSRSAKSAILTHLEALNYVIYDLLHFLRLKLTKLTKSKAQMMVKKGSFRTSRSSKIDFT